MERRTGHDPQLVFGEGSARDTLDIVLVCLSLLLFTLLLSWRAARLQRDSMSACSGGGDGALLEIGGLRCAAGALVLPPLASWHWRLGGALRIWEMLPDAPPGSMFGPLFWSWRPHCCDTGT